METRSTRTAEQMAKRAPTNVLRMLTFMAAQPGPVTARSLQDGLGLPRSSTYELLEALCAEGYAVRFPAIHRYGLGMRAFELSSAYSRQDALTRLGRGLLQSLVDRLHENVHITVLNGPDVVYVAEERAPHRPLLVTRVGVRIPASQTASGRAILSCLPRPQVLALYPDPQRLAQRNSDLSPTTLRELDERLREIRQQGYATEIEEVTPGLGSLALPVHDHNDWPIASIGVTFDLAKGAPFDQRIEDALPLLQRHRDELGRRLNAGQTK